MDVVREWKIDDNRYDKLRLHTKYIIVKSISDKYTTKPRVALND